MNDFKDAVKNLQKIDINNIQSVDEFETASPLEMSTEALVTLDEVIKADPAITLGWHTYKGKPTKTVFGSYGDFSCIVGASKSMKTKLKIALVAAYIGNGSGRFFPDFAGVKSEGKVILDLDTEQSRYHVQRMKRDILEMSGYDDLDRLKTYGLRRYSPKERLAFLEWLAYESPYMGNIGLIIVDGAADLIDDTNDLVQSQRLTNIFMKITEVQHCHLITILHRTKSSNKPTGHLGSAILKKAETVAFVSRDDLIVQVTPEYTRNFPFKDFKFTLNEDSLPIDLEHHNDMMLMKAKDLEVNIDEDDPFV